jgi:hypothetical protein
MTCFPILLMFSDRSFFFVTFLFNFSFFFHPSSKPSLFCCLSFGLSFRYVYWLPISRFISPFFSFLRPFLFTSALWTLSLPVLQYTGKWTKHKTEWHVLTRKVTSEAAWNPDHYNWLICKISLCVLACVLVRVFAVKGCTASLASFLHHLS